MNLSRGKYSSITIATFGGAILAGEIALFDGKRPESGFIPGRRLSCA